MKKASERNNKVYLDVAAKYMTSRKKLQKYAPNMDYAYIRLPLFQYDKDYIAMNDKPEGEIHLDWSRVPADPCYRD